ncbi:MULTISPECIES: hypothetical protein [Ramlibacter]|uniref:Uncharacterized protein n=1 Tax=Ramlibacter pinisoli TaxID=2682844 RepID=A0A6N8J211_9BURK|nr:MULTISPECIES: hypothetical protein [Ramlibacter]MBA2962391.1 hypothetical protein [Ramlibacter sp. CGMCC 1.13660]MVQ32333.1 hypothetical protein [Ramlibacter pinisoli]
MPAPATSRARRTGPRSFRWSVSSLHVEPLRPASFAGVLDGCTSCDGCPAPMVAPARRRPARRGKR